MDSSNMREILTSPYPNKAGLKIQSKTGPNHMKSIISEVGNPQKTSDRLMFALISIKFPSMYDEDL